MNIKNKLSKQAEKKQNHGYGDHLEGYRLGRGRGKMEGKVQGVRRTNGYVQNRQVDVKNSIGNGIAKELTCMTHGHELMGGIAGGNRDYWVEGAKGEPWDNCNSIINKVLCFFCFCFCFFKKETLGRRLQARGWELR